MLFWLASLNNGQNDQWERLRTIFEQILKWANSILSYWLGIHRLCLVSYLIFEMALVRHLLLTPRYWISINVHRGVKIPWYFSPICPNTKCLNGNWMNLNEICWIWNLEMARLLWLTQFFIYLLNFHEISWNLSSYLFELMCTLPFYIGAIMSVFWKTQNEIKLLDSSKCVFCVKFSMQVRSGHWGQN